MLKSGLALNHPDLARIVAEISGEILQWTIERYNSYVKDPKGKELGKPIQGLYAVGEVTGGIYGACRLGSCAMQDCVIFGHIAGKNATSIE